MKKPAKLSVEKRANTCAKPSAQQRNESGEPAPMPDTMKVVHRLAVAIYVVSKGWFALLFLPVPVRHRPQPREFPRGSHHWGLGR